MKTKRCKKIDWKRMLLKAAEDGIKKAIELTILALLVGVTIKTVLVAVPAVTMGAVIAKTVKIKMLER